MYMYILLIHAVLPVVSFAAGNQQIDLPLPPANQQNRQIGKTGKGQSLKS